MKIEFLNFDIKGDERGSLVALESNKNIPFVIKRVYYIFGTEKNIKRGFHAHKELKQVAICVNGSCKIMLDDGAEKKIATLDRPDRGLIIREMIWREMFDFSDDCVLIVLASELYDKDDYIRDYKDFTSIIKRR